MAAASPRAPATIVVDTCSLFMLAAEIPIDFYHDSERPRNSFGLLDALVELSRQGHQIIIPEMVAVEAAETLHNGVTLLRFFDGENDLAEEKTLRAFFKHVRGMPNIKIVPPSKDDTTPAGLFVKSLWKIASSGASGGAARSSIIKLRRSQDTSHFGEQAAFEWIKAQDKRPMTFLSDDKAALCHAKYLGAEMLTSIDFIRVVCEAGLLAQRRITAGWSQIYETLIDHSETNRAVNVIFDIRFTNEGNRRAFAATMVPAEARKALVGHPAHVAGQSRQMTLDRPDQTGLLVRARA